MPATCREWCECVQVILFCLVGWLLVCGYVSYVALGIMYLVQDYTVAHACSKSALWAYVLVAVILSYSRIAASQGASKNADTSGAEIFAGLFCYMLVEIGLATWGGVELFGNACPALTRTRLWDFGLATFVLHILTVCLILVAPLLAFFCATRRKQNPPLSELRHPPQV